jgi:hypothetical protein
MGIEAHIYGEKEGGARPWLIDLKGFLEHVKQI